MHIWRSRFVLMLKIIAVVFGLAASRHATAQDRNQSRPTERKLLFPAKLEDVPESIRPCVAKLLSADQGPVDPASIRATGVFARVVTQKYVINEKGLIEEGMP